MMEPADHREGDDLPSVGGLALAGFRGVLVERQVGPGSVIVLEVLPQERTPGLRRRLSPKRHCPRHRGFCDLEAELEQLAVNTRRSPGRVLAGHSTDERPDIRIDRWTSASVSALPGPVEPKALAMPADHGFGLHEDQGVVPVWPQTVERDPECAVRLGQLGAFGFSLQNG